MEEHQEKENVAPEREPTMRINEKGINNAYLREHLFGKGISPELIKKCLSSGEEMTHSLRQTKKGSRYFKMEIPDGTGMPGRFVLPDLNGPLGGKVANWNAKCEYKFRHGRLVPIIAKKDIPDWLLNYASTFWVIVEKNELPNGKLQDADGPTKDDPEGSWLVATAHFGPPSVPKPRVPKDCSNEKELRYYLQYLDNWTREQYNTIYVDLDADGSKILEETEPSEIEELESLL